MSFQNALHEALVGLKGGDGWFSDKFFAAALRERGMSSVDAQDISRLCKNKALLKEFLLDQGGVVERAAAW